MFEMAATLPDHDSGYPECTGVGLSFALPCSASGSSCPKMFIGFRCAFPAWRLRQLHGRLLNRAIEFDALFMLSGGSRIGGNDRNLRSDRTAHAQDLPGIRLCRDYCGFVGRLKPLGTIPAAFIMALFYLGGELAQSRLGTPAALTGVFQGLLLFCIMACDSLIFCKLKWVGFNSVKGVA